MYTNMLANIPRHIVLVLVDVDFDGGNSQVCAEVVLGAELEIVRAVERAVVSTIGAEYCHDTNCNTIYVKVPKMVACMRGRSTTIRDSSELGHMRCRMQLMAKSKCAWSYVCNAGGRVNSGMTWELDCLHTEVEDDPQAPCCSHYIVMPSPAELTSGDTHGGQPFSN